jgi:TonB family protein
MLPGTEQRKKRNSAKVNLIFSVTFHGLIGLAVFYFAAREGILGHSLQTMTVMLEEKKPEIKQPPKPKEELPKPELPKPVEPVKLVEPPKMTAVVQAPPPPVDVTGPVDIAPPPAEEAPFVFDEESHKVISSTNMVQIYQSLLQDALQFNWDRPRDMDAQTNQAEVELAVGKNGELTGPVITKSSGQTKWDQSVLTAVANTKKVSRPPPTNFPSRVKVQFYVEPKGSLGD